MRDFWARLLHRSGFGERRCAACHGVFLPSPLAADAGSLVLCPECRAGLRTSAHVCPRCGAVLGLAPTVHGCGACLNSPPPWQGVYAVGLHQGLLRDMLLRAKYGHDAALCRALGAELGQVVMQTGARPLHHADKPSQSAGLAHADEPVRVTSDSSDTAALFDAVVPMPLHPVRLRQRGFNQCVELAVPLARQLGLPCLPHMVHRIHYARPQTGLHRAERLRNVRRAFSAHPDLCGLRLLIVDDTMTTGSTLRRLTECVCAAGAASVHIAVVAVTPPHGTHAEQGSA